MPGSAYKRFFGVDEEQVQPIPSAAAPAEAAGTSAYEILFGEAPPAEVSAPAPMGTPATGKYYVDDSLLNAVIGQESGGNPNAVSNKGAKGIAQMIDTTAQEMSKKIGLEYYPGIQFDPEKGKLLGSAYLKEGLDTFGGDPRFALIYYHAGPTAAQKVYDEYQETGVFNVPRTRRYFDGAKYTADYVPEVLARIGGEANYAQSAVSVQPKEDWEELADLLGAKVADGSEQWEEPVAPEVPEPEGILARAGKAAMRSAAGMVKGAGGALQMMGNEGGMIKPVVGEAFYDPTSHLASVAGKAVSNVGQKIYDKFKAEDPNFADSVMEGVASGLSFLVPSVAIGKAAQGMSLIGSAVNAARTAKWLGIGANAVMEASLEGGQIYNDLREKGVSDEDAKTRAVANMATNIGMILLTDKFSGIFEAGKPALETAKKGFLGKISEGVKKLASSVVPEAVQEGGQYVSGTVFKGEEVKPGDLGTSMLVGGIAAGAMHTAMGAAGKIIKKTPAAAPTEPQNNQPVPSGFEGAVPSEYAVNPKKLEAETLPEEQRQRNIDLTIKEFMKNSGEVDPDAALAQMTPEQKNEMLAGARGILDRIAAKEGIAKTAVDRAGRMLQGLPPETPDISKATPDIKDRAKSFGEWLVSKVQGNDQPPAVPGAVDINMTAAIASLPESVKAAAGKRAMMLLKNMPGLPGVEGIDEGKAAEVIFNAQQAMKPIEIPGVGTVDITKASDDLKARVSDYSQWLSQRMADNGQVEGSENKNSRGLAEGNAIPGPGNRKEGAESGGASLFPALEGYTDHAAEIDQRLQKITDELDATPIGEVNSLPDWIDEWDNLLDGEDPERIFQPDSKVDISGLSDINRKYVEAERAKRAEFLKADQDAVAEEQERQRRIEADRQLEVEKRNETHKVGLRAELENVFPRNKANADAWRMIDGVDNLNMLKGVRGVRQKTQMPQAVLDWANKKAEYYQTTEGRQTLEEYGFDASNPPDHDAVLYDMAGGSKRTQRDVDKEFGPPIKLPQMRFSDESGDLLDGTPFEDKRTPAQKKIDLETQAIAESKKLSAMDNPLMGTPMFSPQTRQDMLVEQPSMIDRNGKARSYLDGGDMGPTLMGGPAVNALGKYAAMNGINLEKSQNPAIKRVLFEQTALNPVPIEKAKRGVQTWDETERLASVSGMPTRVLKGRIGKAYNAEELRAANDFLEKSTIELHKEMVNFTKKKQAGKTTAQDVADLQELTNFHAFVLAKTTGANSEAGRSLQILRQIREASRRAEDIQQIIEMAGGSEKISELAADIAINFDPKNPGKINKKLQRSNGIIYTAWLNWGLLSNPATHSANLFSNAFTSGIRTYVERPLASAIETVVAPLQKRSRERFLGEVGAEAAGTGQTVMNIWQLARHSPSIKDFVSSMRNEIDAKTDISSQRVEQFQGNAGAALTAPTKFLAASDDMSKLFTFNSDVRARAYRQAKIEKLSGDAFENRIEELVSQAAMPNAKGVAGRIREESIGESQYRTYTKQLGEFGRAIMRARDKSGIGKWVIPFIKTPTNILKYGLERLPGTGEAVLFHKIFKKGLKGAELSDQLAKLATGYLFAIPVVALARMGQITGSGPDNPDERRAKRSAGWQPYSIKAGDKWLSYARIEPIASILGTVADAFDIAKELKDEGKLNEAAFQVAFAIQKNITSKTFVEGIANIIDVNRDPKRNLKAYTENFARSWVPGVVRGAAMSSDKTFREVDGPVDAIKSSIPGVSKSLPARHDLFGEDLKAEGGFLWNFLSPIKIKSDTKDEVMKEVRRLDVKVQLPKKKFSENYPELTPEQYGEYQELSGKQAYKNIQRMINSPMYRGASDESQASLINESFNIAREVARNKIKSEYRIKPEIKNDVSGTKKKKGMKSYDSVEDAIKDGKKAGQRAYVIGLGIVEIE